MRVLFSIERSGYYAWVKKMPSKRAQANEVLDKKIIPLFNNIKIINNFASINSIVFINILTIGKQFPQHNKLCSLRYLFCLKKLLKNFLDPALLDLIIKAKLFTNTMNS